LALPGVSSPTEDMLNERLLRGVAQNSAALTAAPTAGNVFSGWSGGGCSEGLEILQEPDVVLPDLLAKCQVTTVG
jgi:hypothetical protein